MKKKNVRARRQVALNNLNKAVFTEKGDRNSEEWKKRVDQEIETLEKRLLV